MRGKNILYDEELGIEINSPDTKSFNFLRISKQGSLVSVIDAIYDSDYHIYPNPTTDLVFLNNELRGKIYSIYDISGQLIKTGKVTDSGIATSSLPSGSYVLSIDGQSTQLFVKE